MLFVLRAWIDSLCWSLALEDVHSLIRERGRPSLGCVWNTALTTRESRSHDLWRIAVLVRSRAGNILVVIIAEILFLDGPFCHNSILEIIHHLVLRPRLNFKWADSTLLLYQFVLLFFEHFDSFLQILVVLPNLLCVLIELSDLFFAQAEQVLVTL